MDIIVELLERDGFEARLMQRLNLRAERVHGDRHVAAGLFRKIVPHQHRYVAADRLVRQGRGLQNLGEVGAWRVRCDVSAEIVRNVDGIVARDARGNHAADGVAEVGRVVEIARLTAHAAARKVPEIGDFRERRIEICNIFGLKVLEIVDIDRGGHDDQLNVRRFAAFFDRGDRFHAVLGLAEDKVAGLRIVGKDRIGFEIGVHTADRLDVAHTLVIFACDLVEHVEALRKQAVIAQIFQLGKAVTRVAEQIARVKGQRGRVRVGQVMEVARQAVRLVVIREAVVEIDVQDEVLDFIVFDQVIGDLFTVAHVRAIHD